MEGKPHTHETGIARRYRFSDHGPLEVTYGDTTVRVRSALLMRLFGYPSAAKVARLTRLAIRRHDEGSRKAEKSERDRRAAEAAAKAVHSDWWMDSQERMDQLHGHALFDNGVTDRDRGLYAGPRGDAYGKSAALYVRSTIQHLDPAFSPDTFG